MRNDESGIAYIRAAVNHPIQGRLKIYRETPGEGSDKCLTIKPRFEHHPVSVCPFMRKPDAAINQVLGEGFGYGQNCNESFGDFLPGQFRSSTEDTLQSLAFSDGFDDSLFIPVLIDQSGGLSFSRLLQFFFEDMYILDCFAISGDSNVRRERAERSSGRKISHPATVAPAGSSRSVVDW